MPVMTLMFFAPILPFRFPLLNFSMGNGNDALCQPLETLKRRFNFWRLNHLHAETLFRFGSLVHFFSELPLQFFQFFEIGFRSICSPRSYDFAHSDKEDGESAADNSCKQDATAHLLALRVEV